MANLVTLPFDRKCGKEQKTLWRLRTLSNVLSYGLTTLCTQESNMKKGASQHLPQIVRADRFTSFPPPMKLLRLKFPISIP